jgi:serine/threonine protein kinase
VQLIDFGLSKHLESVATLGIGTPDYLLRELQFCSGTALSALCDIASQRCLCCIVVLLQLIVFGLSKHLESGATLGVATPDYMPPEMTCSAVCQHTHTSHRPSACLPLLFLCG